MTALPNEMLPRILKNTCEVEGASPFASDVLDTRSSMPLISLGRVSFGSKPAHQLSV